MTTLENTTKKQLRETMKETIGKLQAIADGTAPAAQLEDMGAFNALRGTIKGLTAELRFRGLSKEDERLYDKLIDVTIDAREALTDRLSGQTSREAAQAAALAVQQQPAYEWYLAIDDVYACDVEKNGREQTYYYECDTKKFYFEFEDEGKVELELNEISPEMLEALTEQLLED